MHLRDARETAATCEDANGPILLPPLLELAETVARSCTTAVAGTDDSGTALSPDVNDVLRLVAAESADYNRVSALLGAVDDVFSSPGFSVDGFSVPVFGAPEPDTTRSISTPSSRRTTPSSRRTTRRDFSPRFSPRSPTRALGRRGGSKRSWTKDTATPRARASPAPSSSCGSRRFTATPRSETRCSRDSPPSPRGSPRTRSRARRSFRSRARSEAIDAARRCSRPGWRSRSARASRAGWPSGSGTRGGRPDRRSNAPRPGAHAAVPPRRRRVRGARELGFSRDATSPRVPSSAFQSPELSDALDLRREYVRWIEGKRSFCEFPCVFTTEAKARVLRARGQSCRSASRSRTRGGPRSAFAGWTGAKRACLSATPTRRSWSS